MSKRASKDLNVSVSAVYIDDEATSAGIDVTQETIVTSGLSTVGPTRVVGNYDHSMSLEGVPDFAAAQSDATLFGLIGSSGVATAYEPTGQVVGANDPHYDCTLMLLSGYSLKSAIGAPTTFSASLDGGAALTRAVA